MRRKKVVKPKIKGVKTTLSQNFFDNFFEPERRKLEKEIGTRVTQLNFTEFLAKNRVQFKIRKRRKKK